MVSALDKKQSHIEVEEVQSGVAAGGTNVLKWWEKVS